MSCGLRLAARGQGVWLRQVLVPRVGGRCPSPEDSWGGDGSSVGVTAQAGRWDCQGVFFAGSHFLSMGWCSSWAESSPSPKRCHLKAHLSDSWWPFFLARKPDSAFAWLRGHRCQSCLHAVAAAVPRPLCCPSAPALPVPRCPPSARVCVCVCACACVPVCSFGVGLHPVAVGAMR